MTPFHKEGSHFLHRRPVLSSKGIFSKKKLFHANKQNAVFIFIWHNMIFHYDDFPERIVDPFQRVDLLFSLFYM